MKYRKKPVVIEVVQWNGNNTYEIQDFIENGDWTWVQGSEGFDLYIHTLEGKMFANVDDYIIKGVQGEFYPCKPDIFEMTYEKVEE